MYMYGNNILCLRKEKKKYIYLVTGINNKFFPVIITEYFKCIKNCWFHSLKKLFLIFIILHFTEPVLQLVKESSSSALSSLRYPQEEHRPSSPINTDPNIERLFIKKRPRSPKRHKKISVNQRPFSASNLNQTPSHYVQLLKSPYMQKTVPSPKVLNKLLRPQSGGARLGWGQHIHLKWRTLFSCLRSWL